MGLRERITKLERHRPRESLRCWLSEDGVTAESRGERLPLDEIDKLPGEHIILIVDCSATDDGGDLTLGL